MRVNQPSIALLMGFVCVSEKEILWGLLANRVLAKQYWPTPSLACSLPAGEYRAAGSSGKGAICSDKPELKCVKFGVEKSP